MYQYINKLIHFVNYENILVLNDFDNDTIYILCQDYENLYFKFKDDDIYLGYNNYFEKLNKDIIIDNKDYSNIYKYNIYNVLQTNKQMIVFEKNIFLFPYDLRNKTAYVYDKINIDAPYEYINFDGVKNKFHFLANIIYSGNDIQQKKFINYMFKNDVTIFMHFGKSK